MTSDDGLRRTGLEVLGDVPWGTHWCQFFQTQKDLIDTLVPYFRAGLEAKEFCQWVIDDPLTEERARRALKEGIRERQVLLLAAEGLSNPQIAKRLAISVRTVESHRANLMRKLGVRNQTELVRYALRRGLLPLDHRAKV